VLLTAENLSFAYGAEPTLREASITLGAGQIVALLGPNGSGKSTLIKCLLGDLKPTGGISWNDKPMQSWSRRELAKLVGYLPQSPTAEPQSRVIDVLRLGRNAYWGAFGVESSQGATVLVDIAKRLDLTDLLYRPLDTLSGGQRQRVFVGRCLAQQPKALLLDEPGTFLDLKHQVELMQLLKKLAREQNLGILLASHDLNLAALFADELVLMHTGRIFARGDAASVLKPDILEPVFELKLAQIGPTDRPFIIPSLEL
jgi:iron complex transport system ATP-binding protein